MGKMFRDPLYNYIELADDPCALELISTPVFQRLRRIHQLGVTHYTYPGAQHDRLSHSLGVYHLARMATDRVIRLRGEQRFRRGADLVMAVALLHDVGHGPFSHLVEPCLGVDHEDWTCRIIESPDHQISKILEKHQVPPTEAVALITGKVSDDRRWMQTLVSSQLDVDRLDYLRRDSLMTGAGYGHFDFHRLLNTLEVWEEDSRTDLAWPREKSLYAIEEYIFARYYMYQNVYMHATTRGIEMLLREMWRVGKELFDNGDQDELVGEIRAFWGAEEPDIDAYLAIEEFTLLHQIAAWRRGKHPVLADLARRFLDRDHFVEIPLTIASDQIDADGADGLEHQLRELADKAGFMPDHYVLRDQIKAKYRQPYITPPEGEELTSINAIRVLDGAEPKEISTLLERLRPVTQVVAPSVNFYVPREVRQAYNHQA